MNPWLSWALILAAVPVVYWVSSWLVGWLMRPGPDDPRAAEAMSRHPMGPVHSTAARLRDPEVARELCECRRYLFICEDSDTPHAHEYRDGGTVHRPDLCQPADEAL